MNYLREHVARMSANGAARRLLTAMEWTRFEDVTGRPYWLDTSHPKPERVYALDQALVLSTDAVLTHVAPWMFGRGWHESLLPLTGKVGWVDRRCRYRLWPCQLPARVSERADAMVRSALLTAPLPEAQP